MVFSPASILRRSPVNRIDIAQGSDNRLSMNRRTFAFSTAATTASAALFGVSPATSQESSEKGSRREICAFIKFVQSLNYAEMGAEMRKAGYDGIEATIRKNGMIAPAAAAEELPKLADALQENQCAITLMATDINRADDALGEKVLRAAVAAKVKRYRTAYYRYDLKKSLRPQLAEFRAMARDLAAMNKDLGITGVYQNHAGAQNVGASIWDLDELLEGIDPDHLGVAFDIRHATADGGTTWPALWKLIEPRVRIVYVKDFIWKDRKPHNVPLGQGLVNPEFFSRVTKLAPSIPVSLHVEYLGKAGEQKNLAALESDRKTLAAWLGL